jgi:hypothetical protein
LESPWGITGGERAKFRVITQSKGRDQSRYSHEFWLLSPRIDGNFALTSGDPIGGLGSARTVRSGTHRDKRWGARAASTVPWHRLDRDCHRTTGMPSRHCLVRVTDVPYFATAGALALVYSLSLLITALLLFGAGLGSIDVSMNIMAIIIERGVGDRGGIVGAADVAALFGAGASPFTATLVVATGIAVALATAAPTCFDTMTGAAELSSPSRVAWCY